MASVDVIDLNRRKVGSVELKADLFERQANAPLVHEAVIMQQASARQGTASTKRRGEVSGSGKKPWKQKHTGRARAGSVRSPVWRHGGTVFGPKPRKYGFNMPKGQYRGALQSALSSKAASGELLVISDLPLDQPKTKVLAKVLRQLGLSGSTLLVAAESRVGVDRAARNLVGVTVVRPEGLNVYDVLRHAAVVIPERELARVQEYWS
jgi:large subunit ribosomal protein L4